MALNRRTPENTPEREDGPIWDNLEGDTEYEGRLVMVADLGLQEKKYKGDYQGDFPQISLGIEIIDEGMDDDDGNYLPRVLWTRPIYIYSKMDAKSKEYEYYKVFDPKAKADTVPDWEAQLGKPCNVYVINVEDGDKVYDNISDLTRVNPKYVDNIGDAESELGIGDADDPEDPVTRQLRGLAGYVWKHRVGAEDSSEKDEEPAKRASKSSRNGPAKKPNKAAARKPSKPEEPEEFEEEEEEPSKPTERSPSRSSSRASKDAGKRGTPRRKARKTDDDDDIPY